MYELCQSGKEQMVLEYPLKIYENFRRQIVPDMLFLTNVSVAKRELKALYDIGQCDVYLNLRKKETADRLKCCVLNYFVKNTLNVRTTYDML
jgi:hypothetical protein